MSLPNVVDEINMYECSDDIIVASKPVMKIPLATGGNIFWASIGIECTGSIVSLRKNAFEYKPVIVVIISKMNQNTNEINIPLLGVFLLFTA